MALAEEKWVAARMLWEADPTVSGAQLARDLGVSRNAVNQRIKRENWKRVSDGAELVRRAHDRADEEAARELREQRAKELIEQGKQEEAEAEKNRVEQTREVAVDMRATILARHRKELDGSRTIVYEAIRSKNFDKAKLGKITAEALVIIQNGERKAWGIDTEDKAPTNGTVKVVIERREGAGGL